MHFAIVGSGPSGFYAAEALLRADPTFRVDLLDRLPTPFGLVRGGVAPDHPKIKQITLVYDRIARNSRFRFLGNIDVGQDISVAELRELYVAVVLATGAERDGRLGIPGEHLHGSYGAAEFVGWYNGHPDHSGKRFDLSTEVAVIVGHGNVAADICRMLLTPADLLARTDAPQYVIEALSGSRIREIHLVGRRGPAQAKFTNVELRELGEIPRCRPIIDAGDLELNGASRIELADPRSEIAAKNLDIFRSFLNRTERCERHCHFRFLESPVSLHGSGRVEHLILNKAHLSGEPFRQVAKTVQETAIIHCGTVFQSIGFRGVPISGVPFDAVRGIYPNRSGRILDGKAVVRGLYVTGWIKRGATGVIGTNRGDSVETVKALLDDLPELRSSEHLGGVAMDQFLVRRKVRGVSYHQWLELDTIERRRGLALGKPREKLCSLTEMLNALDGQAALTS